MFVKAHLKHKIEYFFCRKHFKDSANILKDLYSGYNPQLDDKLSLVLGDILWILKGDL